MAAVVLFVHGLESGPAGVKARRLTEAGFEVRALQMPCGRRALVRDWRGWLIAAALVAAAATAVLVGLGPTVRGVCLALATLAGGGLLTRVGMMRRMWRRSIAVQVAALRDHRADAVVGSSFGGAVALELVRRGAWCGPTLLLCPAHRLVARRAWLPPPALPPTPPPMLVVHGRADAVVPLGDSRDLIAGTSARLLEVDDDHGLRAVATATAFAAWLGELGVAPRAP